MIVTPDRNPIMAQRGIVHRIMTEQTVDETKSIVVCPPQSAKNHTFVLRSSAALTGAVILETSPDPEYTGVWAPLAGSPIDVATIGAVAGQLEVKFANISIIAARARISTVVAGGNLTVDYHCN